MEIQRDTTYGVYSQNKPQLFTVALGEMFTHYEDRAFQRKRACIDWWTKPDKLVKLGDKPEKFLREWQRNSDELVMSDSQHPKDECFRRHYWKTKDEIKEPMTEKAKKLAEESKKRWEEKQKKRQSEKPRQLPHAHAHVTSIFNGTEMCVILEVRI